MKLQVSIGGDFQILHAEPADAAYIADQLPQAAGLPGVCRRWVAVDRGGRRLGCALLALDGLGYWIEMACEGGEAVSQALNAEVVRAARARGAAKLTVRTAYLAGDARIVAWTGLGYQDRVEISRWRIDLERALILARRYCKRFSTPAQAIVRGLEPALIPRVAGMRRRYLGGDGSSIERLLRDPAVPDAYDPALCRVALTGDRMAAIWLARSIGESTAYVEAMVVARRYRSDWLGALLAEAGLQAAVRAGKKFAEAETTRANGLLSKDWARVGFELIATKVRLSRALRSPKSGADFESVPKKPPVVAVIGLPAQGVGRLRDVLREMGFPDAPETAEGWLRRIPRDPAFWEAARGCLVLLVPSLAPALPGDVLIQRLTLQNDTLVLGDSDGDTGLIRINLGTKELLTDPGSLQERLKRLVAPIAG